MNLYLETYLNRVITMNHMTRELIELARSISIRPTMYAETPEVAHGMIVALAVCIRRFERTESIGRCFQELRSILLLATDDVAHSPSQTPLLCDDQLHPERRVSYSAIERHSRRFLELLEQSLE